MVLHRADIGAGDKYGSGGGLLDLLLWCGKLNTQLVSEEEARAFYLDPSSPLPGRSPGTAIAPLSEKAEA